MTNWVTFLSSNSIVSSPIKTFPNAGHPTVEKTSILSPPLYVLGNSFSSLVFVEIANVPFTVSGAKTMFQIFSSSEVPSAYTLSTVAEA